MQIDLTADRRHSLSKGSEAFLKELKVPVTVRYYISRKGNELPVRLRSYGERVERFLEDIERTSEKMVEVRIYDPEPDSAAEESAIIDGVQSQTIGNDSEIYFGLAFSSADRSEVLPILDPGRDRSLEYEVLSRIRDVSRKAKPGVGIISSLPVADPGREWQLIRELSESYEVYNLTGSQSVPANVQTLLIIHPRSVSGSFDQRITDFVRRGGGLVVLMDALSLALSFSGTTSNIDDLSSEWDGLSRATGLEFTRQKLVTDMTFSTGLNRGEGFEEINSILSISPRGIVSGHPITEGLSKLSLQMSGAFVGRAADGIKATPLICSTADSELQEAKKILTAGKYETARMHASFLADTSVYDLGLLLEGRFRSFVEGDDQSFEGRMLLLGDADFIADPYAGYTQEVQGEQQFIPTNNNLALVRNALNYFEKDTLLNDARARTRTERPLTVLRQKEREIESQYEASLAQVQKELEDLGGIQSVDSVAHQAGAGGDVASAFQNVRRETRGRQAALEAESRRLKRRARVEVSHVKSRIQWATVLSVPLLTALTGSIVLAFRMRTTRPV